MSLSPENTGAVESTPSAIDRRTMLKRAAAAGLVAVPAVGLLEACAGGSSTTGGTTTTNNSDANNPLGVKDGSSINVVIFNGGLGDEYPKTDKDLLVAKHPKVTVNLSSTQKIKTQEQPKFLNTPSDLINNAGADNMANDTLVNDGSLAELTPLLDAPSWDDPSVKVKDTLLPGTIADGTFDGKVYLLNYAYTVFGMWYNQALFDKNSWTVPKTFDDFFALAPKIKATGVAPITFAGHYPYYSRWAIMSWIWKSGGKQAVVDIDNLKPGAWKADAVLAALNPVEKMIKGGWALPGSDTLTHTQSQQAWLDGKAALLPVGTWVENEMKATIPAGFQMKIANFWSVSSSDKAADAVYAGSGENWVVPKKAANVAGGMEFLRAMLSKAGAGKFAALTHSLASAKGSGDTVNDSTALTSANTLMKGATGDLISFKFPDWYADLDKASQNAIGELMGGRMTAAKFADTMEAAAQKVAGDSSIKKFTRS